MGSYPLVQGKAEKKTEQDFHQNSRSAHKKVAVSLSLPLKRMFCNSKIQ